jgi:parallel beta-helix repeat protein
MKPTTLIGLALLLAPAPVALAGDLTPPPGPVDSTMKTLQQVEPRTPLANDPAGITPLVISQPGSYYLTEDILALANSHGVQITSSHVRLDLRGFAVIGNRATMTLNGIDLADGVANVTIADGTVRDCPEDGIRGVLATGVRIENVTVIANSLHGIYLGEGAALSRCTALENGNLASGGLPIAGLRVGSAGSVSNCTATNNTGYGIYASSAAVDHCTSSQNKKFPNDPINISDGSGFGGSGAFSNCASVDNEDDGFAVGNSTVLNCSARSNLGGGFSAETTVVTDSIAIYNGYGFGAIYDATFDRCRARFNSDNGFSVNYGGTVRNCSSADNGGHGIWVGYDSQIVGNICRANGAASAGIYVPGDSNRVEGNTIHGNDIGLQVTGTDNLVIGNSARGNSPNFDIIAGNEQGQIVTNPGMGFVNSNPWTNFAY